MFIKWFTTVLVCIACLQPLASQAEDACGQSALKNERKDAATIQVLEHAWSVAYRRGDADFERCLLTSNFAEIGRDGSVNSLADELGFAAQNKDKNLPIPALPTATVLIHGDAAVAYVSVKRVKDGKPVNVYNADYYVWEQGEWRVYFSQQTQF